MRTANPLALLAMALALPAQAEVTRFCIDGEFDLGARYQGLAPEAGEFYPARWCVVSDGDEGPVLFSATGRANPDMDGSWTVAFFPPDRVQIFNRDSPPDIRFTGQDISEEARRVRRLDPHRLLAEFRAHPERFTDLAVTQHDGRLASVSTTTELPLRGHVPVEWRWDWSDPGAPAVQLRVDGVVMLRGTGRREILDKAQAEAQFATTPGAEPVEVPGENWPSRVAMARTELAEGVHIVRGVRTGFRHLVIDTPEGLVIGDAPAGWVEFHQLPPADLVPGLGVSGLSERLVDYLQQEFPGRPMKAVVLTHHHDDHAGGARAFVAAGATVHAPAGVAGFLEASLNRPQMPPDRLAGKRVEVIPVSDPVLIGSPPNQARILPLGPGPHADAMLGLEAPQAGVFFVSDVHVPGGEDDAPSPQRAETECWFAGRVAELLPATTRVVNSHSGVVTPVSRLKAYLDSEECSTTQ